MTLTSNMAALLASDVLEMTCTYKHLAMLTDYDIIISNPDMNNCSFMTNGSMICQIEGDCSIANFTITKCEEIPEQVTVQYTVPASHQWIYGSWTCGYGNPSVNDASLQIQQLGEYGFRFLYKKISCNASNIKVNMTSS